MNVKELKQVIENIPDDVQVILQKDAEGNRFSPLCECDGGCVYVPDSSYSGEVYQCCYMEDITDDLEIEEWEEIKNNNKKCLVLIPVN